MKLSYLAPHTRRMVEAKMRDNATDTHAKLEPCVGAELLGAEKITRFNTPVRLRFLHYRKRLIDLDNLCCKAAIDGLKKRGIIQDDGPDFIHEISHTQIKSLDEKTIITIEEI
jgi:Holliday junction resolvase RusA-like endonuclease